MESKKNDTNELIYKTEVDSGIENSSHRKLRHRNSWFPRKNRGGGKIGNLGLADTYYYI